MNEPPRLHKLFCCPNGDPHEYEPFGVPLAGNDSTLLYYRCRNCGATKHELRKNEDGEKGRAA